MFAPRISRSPLRQAQSRGSSPQRLATRDVGQREREDSREDRTLQLSGGLDHVATAGALAAPPPAPSVVLPGRRLLQKKLRIGSSNDPLESDADRVAEQVMRTSVDTVPSIGPAQLQRKCAHCQKEDEKPSTTGNQLQRKCAHCEEEEKHSAADARLQRKCAHCEEEEATLQKKPGTSSESRAKHAEAPSLVDGVLRSSGQPLAANDLSFFSGRFGFDFSGVRIHNDSAAAASAHAVNALAYAAGSDVAFAAGQYQPGTEAGRRLLAHELAHVVQQSSGDRGYLRRRGDPRKAPRVLSCEIPEKDTPQSDEFVLFPNRGTSLGPAEKARIGNYVDRYRSSGSSAAVRVDGYASEPGDESLNWTLSCYRAAAVKEELTRPSLAHNGLPGGSVSTFMQGKTAEFGAEAQNRRATISPPITGAAPNKKTDQGTDDGKKDTGTTPSQDKGTAGDGSEPGSQPGTAYPPPLFSCAINPKCPSDFCKPFPTQKEALDDRAKDGESVLSTIATANPRAEPLFRKYVFSPGPAGDISSEYGADFAASRDTRGTSEQIHALVKADLQSHPPAFPPGVYRQVVDFESDPSRSALRQTFNELATAGLVYSDPFEVPGLFAGGVGLDQGFCTVGANTFGAQADSRSAKVSAQVFRNPDGTFIIDPMVTYTLADTIDFCPGNCGGFFAQHLGNTIQMSRWEASGISGDVPFTVVFQGPSLIGAYNSED